MLPLRKRCNDILAQFRLISRLAKYVLRAKKQMSRLWYFYLLPFVIRAKSVCIGISHIATGAVGPSKFFVNSTFERQTKLLQIVKSFACLYMRRRYICFKTVVVDVLFKVVNLLCSSFNQKALQVLNVLYLQCFDIDNLRAFVYIFGINLSILFEPQAELMLYGVRNMPYQLINACCVLVSHLSINLEFNLVLSIFCLHGKCACAQFLIKHLSCSTVALSYTSMQIDCSFFYKF